MALWPPSDVAKLTQWSVGPQSRPRNGIDLPLHPVSFCAGHTLPKWSQVGCELSTEEAELHDPFGDKQEPTLEAAKGGGATPAWGHGTSGSPSGKIPYKVMSCRTSSSEGMGSMVRWRSVVPR